MEKINKQMKIDEVLNKYPEAADIFVKHGFHCFGCMAASFESIEQGAIAHGINVEKLIEDLNKAIKE